MPQRRARADRQRRGARAGARGGAQVDRAAQERRRAAARGRARTGRVAVIGPNARDRPARRLFERCRKHGRQPARGHPRQARAARPRSSRAGRVHHRERRPLGRRGRARRSARATAQLIAEAVEVARDRRHDRAGDRRHRADQPRGLAPTTTSATAPTSTSSASRTSCSTRSHALGKPLVVVRDQRPPAELARTWSPRPTRCSNAGIAGQEGGTAMAEALFGDVNPGGKLPVTVVRDVGPDPALLQPQADARGAATCSTTSARCSRSGYGLSATPASRSSSRAFRRRSIAPGAGASRSRSTCATPATRAGDEVVQVYVRDQVALGDPAGQGAQGLRARHAAAGRDAARSRFTLGPEAFALVEQRDERGRRAGRVRRPCRTRTRRT